MMNRLFLTPMMLLIVASGVLADASTQKATFTAFALIGKVDGVGENVFERSPFSADSGVLLTRDRDVVRVWDARTLRAVSQPLQHDRLTYSRLSNDGKTVLTYASREVRLWDVATSKVRCTMKMLYDVLFIEVSPDGTLFLTLGKLDGFSEVVTVWRAGEPKPLHSLQHNQRAWSCAFNSSGSRILTEDYESFHLWSTDAGREVGRPINIVPSSDAFNRGKFDNRGRLLALQGHDDLDIVDALSGDAITHVKLPDPLYTDGLTFSADGKMISVRTLNTGSRAPTRIYDTATGKLVREFGYEAHMEDCQIAPGCGWALCKQEIAMKSSWGIWDVRTGENLQRFEFRDPHGAYLSPDGTAIAFEGPDRMTQIWRSAKREEP